MIDKTARLYANTKEGDWVDIDLYDNGMIEISIMREWELIGAVSMTKADFFKEMRISGIIEEG
ncbi:hypothetical protein Spock_22 [Bacillus phage Spock]|uniref:Uncharacterized protein n=2 Tax=Bequatrovirus spock TaxID=1918008 RepID=A0A1X9SG10_9CAUD|nr:hypothetical protein Spock_22 [Bacillus phage Spock]AGY48422.1 hypothetical protein Spock_22 [Bacillus phage Spock]ARQ94937.1 hypothetical protein FLAPJACK_23 [Bacillus phage Flapjack]